ncbi:histone lysine demethylase PHF8-like isoform X2 [Thrips palmi]|uniref:Histone lysine demethylase PHF8-like isoform X2 n=1 Tax=Thrips palmi TaxID=161013 RepID=A0A6P8ZZ21_THRPL|nr:histone lysine demethylase PHF8-like isoform X2 [Thrips palmi]
MSQSLLDIYENINKRLRFGEDKESVKNKKMASDELPVCVCGLESVNDRFMIECDICKTWYHGDCVTVFEYEAPDIAKYHCPRCEPMYGPSTYNAPANYHRHDCNDANAETKPVQTGTPVFITELKTRHFPPADEVVQRLQGPQITTQYLYQNGFDYPILIEDKDGLEMKLPPDDFSLRDIEKLLSSERELDVIDVSRQIDFRMKMRDLVHYYRQPVRRRILNVISLEFSDTAMNNLVDAPLIARQIDWVNYVWPDDDNDCERPKVQKYCLIGAKDSYTDFHIDFGGSSVWYHVMRGEKVFYLIKPTQANLSLYQRWMTSSTQHDMFFGDQVDACYRLVLRRGNTLLIPTGWIHAVLTPCDTLVFGGNFLHSFNIPLQIEVYETELKMNTPQKFRFPAFERTHWYAGERLVQELQDCRSSNSSKYMTTLLTGAKALVSALKLWNIRRVAEEVPATVDTHKLLKELSKEIRNTERHFNHLWPPKPERESKRQKKKPIDKDFVDFSSLKDEQMKISPKSPKKEAPNVTPIKVLLSKDKFDSELAGTLASVSGSLCKTECTDNQDSNDSTKLRLKLTLPKPNIYPYSNAPSLDSSSPYIPTTSPGSPHQMPSSPNVLNVKNPRQKSTSKRNKQTVNSPKVEVIKNEHLQKDQVTLQNSSTPSAQLKGGTILRFKFGPKGSSVVNKQVPLIDNDIYDFHDSDEDNRLFIDEKVGNRKSKNLFNVNINDINPEIFGADMEVAGEVDVVSDTPKNGIEELLKASCYTVEPPEDVYSGRATQSTREAIAGMLSLGSSGFCEQDSASGRSHQQRPKVHLPVRSKIQQLAEELGEPIDKVHQDEDYIYPSLDASDDEDGVFKPRSKRPMDEAWNPKARVGPVGPKVHRPAREGAKKQSVEKGLEAAAAKRAGLPPPKRPYFKKTPKAPVEAVPTKVEAPKVLSSSTATTSTTPQQAAQTVQAAQASQVGLAGQAGQTGQVGQASQATPPPTSPGKSAPADASQKKVVKIKTHRKGMATAKQRLGKILKIHKMIY